MRTEALRALMQEWRHDFHQHPELGFEETRTAACVAELLRSFGLDVYTGLGKTGVVGVLQKGNGTRAIGLRADMDALPITEQTGLEYASANAGTMHACGHDGHTAMLLGAAKYLSENGNFNGRAVFVFQPAEEHGKGGPAMLRDGLFEQFPVDHVYGMHNMPGMAVGAFGTRTGAMMASEALFEIEIRGQGGHAAMPHRGADAMVVSAEVITALQTIVSRKLDPGLNGVVSVTEIATDGQRNVLPGFAKISGDARALSPAINREIERRMRRIVEGVCHAHGVEGTVSYETVFEVLVNAPGPTGKAVACARREFGDKAVTQDLPPVLASEDFAHMARVRPGCFVFAGNGTEGAHARPLHSADYDFNDGLLVPGSSFWVALVEQELAAGAG